jgi:hypothetical protein
MAKIKDLKETGRLTIICNSDATCTTKVKGDTITLVAALACLIVNDDENNQFRDMLSVAIKIVLDENKKKKKLAKKKKAIAEEVAPKKKAAVKKK